MSRLRKLLALPLLPLLALPLMAFAPVPNVSVYHGDFLYPEEGGYYTVTAGEHHYKVTAMLATPDGTQYQEHMPYHGVIAILDTKNNIRFYQKMSEAQSDNTYGALVETHRRHYASLTQLRQDVTRTIKHAHKTF